MKINIKQKDKFSSRKDLDALEHLILVLPDNTPTRKWPRFPYADIIEQRLARSGKKPTGETLFATDLPNKRGTHVVLAFSAREASSFERLTLARRLVARQLEHNPHSVAFYAPGFDSGSKDQLAEAIVAASLACTATMPEYKSSKKEPARLSSLILYGLDNRIDFKRTLAEAAGNNLARHLTALPPNELTPKSYLQRITELASDHGWRLQFNDMKSLKRKKAGAFLAVAQGSAEQDAGIVQLTYQPGTGRSTASLALIGKGICYDTGGMNLKPAKHMHGMHEDMEGSAVALGTLLALTQLKVPLTVHCWLALAQNHIGPAAYKQNDVITASNGTTIEVMHTDAEGRMVLADTLALASKGSPDLMIDYATLTGTCVYALSTRYSGAFTNRDQLIPVLIAAGRDSGERVWPFPVDKDFDKALDSTIADIRQCTLEGEADHILAARFLSRFTGDTPWLHIDLAAGNHKGGLAHIPTDITGFGVRFTLNLILDKQILTTL
jgi:leucyl aminopeptidase